MEDKKMQEAMATLEEEYTPEELAQMSDITHRMAIMIGVMNCGTIESETLCNQIYKDKNELIPMEQIVWAYQQKLNLLLGDELLYINDEWVIHPDLVDVVQEHKAQLEESIPPGTILN